MFPFAIGSKTFPFEAHVIEDLTFDVISGGDFFQNFCAKIDFDEGIIQLNMVHHCSPQYVCYVHANSSLVIPPESEIIVLGTLIAELPLKKIVCGMVVPRNDLLSVT